jgi:DNA-binding MarR family transcriptional regulator
LNEERIGVEMRDNHEENKEQKHHDDHHDDHHQGDHHQGEHHQGEHHQGDHHHGEHHRKHHQEEYHPMGRHERHGNQEMCIFDQSEDNLLTLLAKTGHFMHHKRGGKRGQSRILIILAENPEISQKELQEFLGIESGSMSEIVIKLEHKGLITRTKDEMDKRMTKLMITELGLELSKEIETRDTEEDKLLLDSLTEEEQEQLKVLLKKMIQGWEKNYEVIREKHHRHAEGEEHCHRGGRRHHKMMNLSTPFK